MNLVGFPTLIVTAVSIIFLIFANVSNEVSAQTDSQHTISPILSDSCIQNSIDFANSNASHLDQEKAKFLATSHEEFAKRTKGNSTTFHSIFNQWSINNKNCSLTWKNVNVVYLLNDTHGRLKNLVVTIKPDLKTVTNVTEYKSFFRTQLPNWSGYEFAGTTPLSTHVYGAQTTFYQPSVLQPLTGPDCISKICDLSIWTGLEDQPGGYPDGHLAQLGSAGDDSCNRSPCSQVYNAWYEFLPAGVVNCLPISANDQIFAQIINEAQNPGGDPTKYDTGIVDITSGSSSGMCNVVYSYPAMTSPLLGSFINERDCRNNCLGATPTYAALPKFGADTMGVINQQSRIWYNGAWTLIGTPYA